MISDATLAAQANLDKALRRVDGETIRELTKAWATAWDEVAPALQASLTELLATPGDEITTAAMLRNRRLNQALALIGNRLEQLAKTSEARISGDIAGIIDKAGTAQAAIIATQLPAGFLNDIDSWSRIDAYQINAAVARSTQQITALHYPLSTEAYDVVRRETIRGVTVGENPRRTAARMIKRAEQGFNGGLNRALVIARTEAIDAYRIGAAMGQSQHVDVLKGWTWLAEFSERTCPSCLAMHGTEHPMTEPGPLDHQQGRCARMPTVKPWRELGVTDQVEPPSIVPDADEYFRGLPQADQISILGKTGYDDWVAGRFPMDQWSARRRTPGWRDSYVPAKPPSSTSRSAAA